MEDAVERQARAYNAHDPDEFVACYAEGVVKTKSESPAERTATYTPSLSIGLTPTVQSITSASCVEPVAMGGWRTAIFSHDTALDVRDEWRDAVLHGQSAGEATPCLLKSFEDYLGEDEDMGKFFWMALAAARFEAGRLLWAETDGTPRRMRAFG